jgi:hypothetical protein
MAAPTTGTAEEVEARGQTFPLNSRRLTAAVIARVARELGLSVSASLEDLRQIVGGKIEEMGHEPQNVRVTLSETRGLPVR